MVQNLICLVSEHFYGELVVKRTEKHSVVHLIESKRGFKYFIMSRYATEVTFHQCNRYFGLMQEIKVFFSKKYRSYGLTVEVLIVRNELVMFRLQSYPRPVAGIRIMQQNFDMHSQN